MNKSTQCSLYDIKYADLSRISQITNLQNKSGKLPSCKKYRQCVCVLLKGWQCTSLNTCKDYRITLTNNKTRLTLKRIHAAGLEVGSKRQI